jgi:diaminopimelate decarboxylase
MRPDPLPAASLHEIARSVGTPCYVYSRARVEANYRRLRDAFEHAADALGYTGEIRLCYAVKANANLELLKVLVAAGAGFDVVSGGEMHAALRAGARAADIVFAGVGKRDDELQAAIEVGVGWINVESLEELRVLSDLAQARGKRQRVALRVNPGVDPRTHAYLATGKRGSKFGIAPEEALAAVGDAVAYPGVSIEGLHVHNGSTIVDTGVYAESAGVMFDLVERCRALGASITDLDMGGGFGVAYTPEQPDADIDGIARELIAAAKHARINLQFEPGRYIVADACELITRVLYTKHNGDKRYVIVDAAMNDLIRPALYGAVHGIRRVPSPDGATEHGAEPQPAEVVGPICESGDFLGHDVLLPPTGRGDLLSISHVGAYGRAMASNYNLRPRAAEVALEGDWWRVIREREGLDEVIGA